MLEAAKNGNRKEVDDLLRRGASVNVSDSVTPPGLPLPAHTLIPRHAPLARAMRMQGEWIPEVDRSEGVL